MDKTLLLSLAAGAILGSSSLFASASPSALLTDFAPYEAVTQKHSGRFITPDFALLRALDAAYAGATEHEQNSLDLTHQESLVPTAKAWQDLFGNHTSPTATTFVSEITSTIETQNVTPEWMTYLSLRFAASISGDASAEEHATYDDETFEGALTYKELLESWHSHTAFKQALDKFAPLRDLRFFAPKHSPEKRVLLPILGTDELCLHDLLFMNLYTIAPVSIPLKTVEGRIHGLSNPSPLGFALHDALHGVAPVFPDEESPAPLPEDFPVELRRDEVPFEDIKEATHQKYGVLLDVSKYLAHKTLEQGFESQAFRQTVFSLFTAQHETLPWTQALLAAPTLDDSIDALADHVRGLNENFFEPLLFHVTPSEEGQDHDLFHTSVFDGSTTLSDFQIATAFAAIDPAPKPPIPMSFKFDATPVPFIRTPDRIKASATYAGEESYVNPMTHEVFYLSQFNSSTDVETLHYRIKNAEGTRSMLDYVTPHTLPAPVTLGTLLQGREALSFTQEEVNDASRSALVYLKTLGREASRVLGEFAIAAKALLAAPEAKNLHARHDDVMARLAEIFPQED